MIDSEMVLVPGTTVYEIVLTGDTQVPSRVESNFMDRNRPRMR
jgi:hypothetical protein